MGTRVQFGNFATVEVLPLYTPSPAEKADAGLYAANVRALLAHRRNGKKLDTGYGAEWSMLQVDGATTSFMTRMDGAGWMVDGVDGGRVSLSDPQVLLSWTKFDQTLCAGMCKIRSLCLLCSGSLRNVCS